MLRRTCLRRGLSLLTSGQTAAFSAFSPADATTKPWSRSRYPHTWNIFSELHCSAIQLKSKMPPKKSKQREGHMEKNAQSHKDDNEGSASKDGVGDVMKEMQDMEERLKDELKMHFSLHVDLRQYEQIPVKLEGGEVVPMNHVGRITMKSPMLISINFTSNPSALKAAKLAIAESALGNPQQEGAVLHIAIARMTREKREEKAKAAKKIFNDYKDALNRIYTKHDKHAQKTLNSEEGYKARDLLLSIKRSFEKRGEELVKAKQDALLAEMI